MPIVPFFFFECGRIRYVLADPQASKANMVYVGLLMWFLQVLIRIRPISDAENATHGQKRCLLQDSSKTLSWTGHPETMFTFDHVACETISQVSSVLALFLLLSGSVFL
jgi:hypothetical protein